MLTKQTDGWRTLPQFDNHEYVIALSDEESGLRAYIAIHSSLLGPAHGGTRMKEYVSETEALADALNLSRAMSYKSALAGLPYGGAKGVILLQPGQNKQAVLKAYAQKIEKLGGLFHTGTDVGLEDADISFMSQFTKYMLGVKPREGTSLTTSSAAATGVFLAMKAAAKHVFGSSNLRERLVGVKGVGKLGSILLDMLHDEGARLIIAEVDSEKVVALTKKYPDLTVVDSETIHAEILDIYSPCALGAEFTNKTIGQLKCKLVVGGANNQLEDVSMGDKLWNQGIAYVPDYIANAGGLIFVSEELEADGFNPQRMEARLRHIAEVVDSIFAETRKTQKPIHLVADETAMRKLKGKNL